MNVHAPSRFKSRRSEVKAWIGSFPHHILSTNRPSELGSKAEYTDKKM